MTLEFEAEGHFGRFAYAASLAAANEIVVLFGHSGAGKSITLQYIAGLLRPERGRISLGGRIVFDSAAGIHVPPQQRRAGYVVQELALFEHLSVAENVAFGIPKSAARPARVRELLELLDLHGFEHRRPRTLSGGQRQRVALARALGREAPLLLLDEPFSALDDSLRTSMRRELLRLREQLGLTILFVTHDLREAHFLADRIAVFDDGRILQDASREAVFRRPASRRVAELTGVANIWRGTVDHRSGDGLAIVDIAGLQLATAGDHAPGTQVDVLIRAERVNVRREGVTPGANAVAATLIEEYAYGSVHTVRFRPDGPGPVIEVELASRPYEVLHMASDRRFVLELPPADLHVVPVGPSDGP